MSWPIEHNPTNPDAVPAYNDSVFKFWNWLNSVWNCNDWITWHKAMTKKYGIDKANNIFVHYWRDVAFGSSITDCRTFNSTFRDYTKSVGLYDNLYSGVENALKPVGAATDIVGGVSDAASNAAKAVRNISRFIVPLLAIAIVIMAFIYAKKMKFIK